MKTLCLSLPRSGPLPRRVAELAATFRVESRSGSMLLSLSTLAFALGSASMLVLSAMLDAGRP